MGQRLDSYGIMPSGLSDYLQLYGWRFSPKMVDWAISQMKKKNPQTGKEENIEKKTKEQVDEIMKKYGVTIDASYGYDSVFVFHMACSDFKGSSITDDAHLALFVKDYLTDVDSYDGLPLTRFYADCIGKGIQPPWLELL